MQVFIGLTRVNYLSLRSNRLTSIRPGVLEHLLRYTQHLFTCSPV